MAENSPSAKVTFITEAIKDLTPAQASFVRQEVIAVETGYSNKRNAVSRAFRDKGHDIGLELLTDFDGDVSSRILSLTAHESSMKAGYDLRTHEITRRYELALLQEQQGWSNRKHDIHNPQHRNHLESRPQVPAHALPVLTDEVSPAPGTIAHWFASTSPDQLAEGATAVITDAAYGVDTEPAQPIKPEPVVAAKPAPWSDEAMQARERSIIAGLAKKTDVVEQYAFVSLTVQPLINASFVHMSEHHSRSKEPLPKTFFDHQALLQDIVDRNEKALKERTAKIAKFLTTLSDPHQKYQFVEDVVQPMLAQTYDRIGEIKRAGMKVPESFNQFAEFLTVVSIDPTRTPAENAIKPVVRKAAEPAPTKPWWKRAIEAAGATAALVGGLVRTLNPLKPKSPETIIHDDQPKRWFGGLRDAVSTWSEKLFSGQSAKPAEGAGKVIGRPVMRMGGLAVAGFAAAVGITSIHGSTTPESQAVQKVSVGEIKQMVASAKTVPQVDLIAPTIVVKTVAAPEPAVLIPAAANDIAEAAPAPVAVKAVKSPKVSYAAKFDAATAIQPPANLTIKFNDGSTIQSNNDAGVWKRMCNQAKFADICRNLTIVS